MSLPIVCQNCGHKVDPHDQRLTHAIISGSCVGAQGDEMAVIQQELRRLEGLISHLNLERAILLRKVNSIQANTCSLPHEILSEIFQYVRPPIHFHHRQTSWGRSGVYKEQEREKHHEDDENIKIGAVSYHWRQVAWGTPQLWTALSIAPRPRTLANNLLLLDLHLQNSQGLLMALELDLGGRPSHRFIRTSAEAQNQRLSCLDTVKTLIITPNAGKLHELVLIGIPPNWVPSIDVSLSRCGVLTVCTEQNSYVDPSTPLFGDLPHLYHLRLDHFEFTRHLRFACSFPLITTLELQRVDIYLSIQLLIHCPNLTHFKNLFPCESLTPSSDIMLPEIVMIGNLQHLAWDMLSEGWCRAFLQRFRFFKLKSLSWHDFCRGYRQDYQRDNIRLSHFFSHLPTTLTCIDIMARNINYASLSSILWNCPHIEQLKLIEVPGRTAEMTVRSIGGPVAAVVLQGQRYIYIDPNETAGPNVFVALKTLVLEGGKDESRSLYANYIVEMMERLYAIRPVTEPFLFKSNLETMWDDLAKDRIKALLARGVELQIIQDSAPLNLSLPSIIH